MTAPERTVDRRHDVRLDIQGLRAVAVMLVVLYHFWPKRLTGGFIGVDVFFVVSGFLITSHLVKTQPSRPRDLAVFWGRRIRRLLPASLLVLTVTLVASRLVAPETQWLRTAKEAVSAALYVENWQLVASSTDYLASEAAPTPVQHFWSLSVEEQFYAVWPILLLLVTLVAARTSLRRVLLNQLLVGAVLAASFAYSVYATANEPASAYFLTTTRVWELAVGGLLATLAPRAIGAGDRAVSTVVAWLAIGTVLVTAVLLDGSTPFPGSIAAVPVVATAVFLWARPTNRWSPMALLAPRPVQWLGDVSYSVYLWHWPLIVLVPQAVGHALEEWEKVIVLGVTLVLAGLTKKLVEDPWRRGRTGAPLRRPFQLAVIGMLVIGVTGAAQGYEVRQREDRADQQLQEVLDRIEVTAPTPTPSGSTPSKEPQSCIGAAAMVDLAACPRDPAADVVPDPVKALKDQSDIYPNKCMSFPPYSNPKDCHFGKGAIRIALVGNSHAAHWLPTLQALSKAYDLDITTFIASECSTVEGSMDFDTAAKDAGCRRWRDETLRKTSGDAFDLVITSQRNVHPMKGFTLENTYDAWVDGFRGFLEKWSETGTNVLVIRDTPFPAVTIGYIPDCVAENPDNQDVCSAPRDQWLPKDPMLQASQGLPGFSSVDLSSFFCEPERCYGVNGGVITYFDGSHMTETYARTMAPYLAPAIARALGT